MEITDRMNMEKIGASGQLFERYISFRHMGIMKYFLAFILICSLTGSYSQEVMILETPDTTYAYIDADYELLTASSAGDTNKLKAFLTIGSDVNTSTWDGVTPLMFAAQNGHLRTVEILIDSGAKVNMKPYNHIDALLGAVIAGHVLIADTLILNGANVNTRNLDGVTPLMYAAAYDHYLLADVLLFYNALVNTADNYGNSSLHYSAFFGNLEITSMLVENGADLDATEIDGFTPLMCAAQNGHQPVVQYLIDAGCDLAKTNDANIDALSLAIMNRFPAVADLLLLNGANASRMLTKKTNQCELARETAGKEMSSLIESYGGQPLQKYRVSKLIINYDVDWNSKDVMMGGSLGLLESNDGWEAELGFRARPWVRSVRYEFDALTEYQFWEKRSLLYAGAGKRFNLTSPRVGESIGAFVSANIGYTYGSFRGSNKTPDNAITFIPKGGFYYVYKALNLKIYYEYFNIKGSSIPPHRIVISVGAGFNLLKSNYKNKKEPSL